MHFKLIIIMVEDNRTRDVLDAAREAGATGCTVLNQARGEGVVPAKTFLGLSVDSQVDVILLLAEEHLSRQILETVAQAGEFDERPGTGIAFQLDVEDAIGVRHQIAALTEVVEERL
ncbi:MAG: P-II family nitrogen regulator [Xanthomonadales bacterium]|nr:P-II family nitrogen regulator [Xanthomonadales bacterium]NIN60379.1 P-II family nitrogen regulator [Xanthomonadales bacterium]NIN75732.1 P-II family nitrogen regulator [Xanthomonadales bacterium]NIO14294.1 P-II family nitrogen regulator [Xanthomonadales bacterium]NIP12772.1 P-II family nitrogen regulator [Xanthomonadales bacterium]